MINVARQDVVEVPKEIRQLHKRVTLSIDIFFVNGVPYFATLSLKICFLSVTHLSNRKIPTIFRALKAMHNYYLQRGFQIVFVKGDGEFKPLKDLIESELFGGPTMNLSSANEHVPEIERKIRVIKERLRAIIYSMPVNAVPSSRWPRIAFFYFSGRDSTCSLSESRVFLHSLKIIADPFLTSGIFLFSSTVLIPL